MYQCLKDYSIPKTTLYIHFQKMRIKMFKIHKNSLIFCPTTVQTNKLSQVNSLCLKLLIYSKKFLKAKYSHRLTKTN